MGLGCMPRVFRKTQFHNRNGCRCAAELVVLFVYKYFCWWYLGWINTFYIVLHVLRCQTPVLATGDNTNEKTVSEHVLNECVEQIQFHLSSFRKKSFSVYAVRLSLSNQSSMVLISCSGNHLFTVLGSIGLISYYHLWGWTYWSGGQIIRLPHLSLVHPLLDFSNWGEAVKS